jgi:alkylation response protein AidB-like acyl-CoA dehydrogenase
MHFAFSEEQKQAQSSLRSVLDRECPATFVRAQWTAPTPSNAVWQRLGEMGVFGVLVPESLGGLGGTELDLVLLLEECGRAGVVEPVIETAMAGAALLSDLAPCAVAAEWLPRIAAGEALIGLGLSGTPYVADADRAALLLLEDEGALYAVSPEPSRLSRQASVDGARRLFRVEWHPAEATLVASGDACKSALARAHDRAALGAAAELLGLGRRMIDMTADYVKVRHQFGVPVGSFQAVKHPLASALSALEIARPVVHRAAYALAKDEPRRGIHVSMAKAYASDAATLAARVSLQCHGAIGYSFEHDLHLFMKRSWALAAAWGDAASHRERVAKCILDAPPGHELGEP